ncbi:hypothetical protein DRZ77_02080 [Candidatus Woesearchaeota archaeon]|nr:RimK/LysX family protein [Candidatus Woesearchaeota archaeon]RLE40503.1 MAG: hypothetical protein DRZ77_02080 [Candidatus Woesearchaeota archaeon]
MNKLVIGVVEKVRIIGRKRSRQLMAKIDTGATNGSIDEKLADELALGPVIKTVLIKHAHGNKIRPVVKAKVEIAGKMLEGKFTLANRRHMRYKVLIGLDVLKKGFLIDPNKRG